MQLLNLLVHPSILLDHVGVSRPRVHIGLPSLLIGVLFLLLVAEFVVHVTLLNLGTTFHEPLDYLVHLFVLPHVLDLLLVRFGDGEPSEVEISIVLHQGLPVSYIFEV